MFDLAEDVVIRNNIFYAAEATNTTGVVITSQPRPVSITGNYFNDCTSANWQQTGPSSNFVAQDVIANCINRAVNPGSGNVVYGWGVSAP